MVDLRPDHLATVQAILRAEVPSIDVWAFGSRAKWMAQDASDLDLVLVSDQPVPFTTLSRLHRAFEESYLPFGVDLVDWNRIEADFRAEIEAEKVVLQHGTVAEGAPGAQRRALPLSECATFLSGGTPSKAKPELWEGPIPWLTAKDMKRLRLWDTEDHVAPEAIGNGTRLVPKGTILLLVRGMTLHKDLPLVIAQREMAFNQDVRALIARSQVVDNEFLAYSLLANKLALLSLVDSASHGIGRFHSEALESFPIAVPSLAEQRASAQILATLDAKIDLNRQMNETLEGIARALGSEITSTSREDFYRLQVVQPTPMIQRAFSEIRSPLWERKEQAKEESRTLAALRDALLPKLISGEIRIKDAERLMSKVA
ncbi:MAG TPA: restriction endonuclease subunit S [Thermoanaerobaculia bacterium]|jgi:type I restriction enzyme S subunit|nr:restriction endonuclease subunit S [Thermoanaerobaculia bacterium]